MDAVTKVAKDIWIDFTVPGPIFGRDLIAAILGLDLGPILKPLMRAERHDEEGQRIYPLVLRADDPGAVLTARTFGAFCVKNHKGRIAVFVPPPLVPKWEDNVSEAVRGKGHSGHIGNSPATAYLLTLDPGATASLAIPLVGFLGIRLAPVQP